MAFITEFSLGVPGWERTYLFANKKYPIVILRFGFITFIKFDSAAMMLFQQIIHDGTNIDEMMKKRTPVLSEWKRETEARIRKENQDQYESMLENSQGKFESVNNARLKAEQEVRDLKATVKTLVAFKEQP